MASCLLWHGEIGQCFSKGGLQYNIQRVAKGEKSFRLTASCYCMFYFTKEAKIYSNEAIRSLVLRLVSIGLRICFWWFLSSDFPKLVSTLPHIFSSQSWSFTPPQVLRNPSHRRLEGGLEWVARFVDSRISFWKSQRQKDQTNHFASLERFKRKRFESYAHSHQADQFLSTTA